VTERKPAWMNFESWIDKQIREAEERGEFTDLPGAGKPIPGIDEPADELWWVKAYLKRERLSYLPPSLRLRKDHEDVLAAVPDAPSERAVRAAVTALNEKIAAAIRMPPAGPPLNLGLVDVEEQVGRWAAARQAP
jgi:DnaJ homologue, subfamily C, member 28, conserved domain